MKNFWNKPVRPAALLAAGLLFKFILMFTEWNVPTTDFDGYFRVAKTILSHFSFGHPPGYDVLPGYSVYLALGIFLFGEAHLVFFNLPLFALASWLFLKLLQELGIMLRVWSAGLFFFLWFMNPFFHFLNARLMSENAFVPAMLGFVYLFLRYLKSGKFYFLAGAFAVLAAASWVRAVGLYFPLFFLFCFVVFKRPIAHFMLAVFIFFTLIVPWGIRNYFLFDDFNMVSSRVWQAVWGGNNEFMSRENAVLRGNWMGLGDIQVMTKNDDLKERIARFRELYDAKRFQEAEAFAKDQVMRFWKEHTAELPLLVLNKLKWFWHFSARHPLNRTWYYDLMGCVWYLIWLPLLVPFFKRRDKPEFAAIFVGFSIYFSAVTAVSCGMVRFRMPLEPLLLAVFIFSVPYVVRRWER